MTKSKKPCRWCRSSVPDSQLKKLYRTAVAFIAYNDGPGDSGSLIAKHVAGTVSVILVSEVFNVPAEVVAASVIRRRRTWLREYLRNHEENEHE